MPHESSPRVTSLNGDEGNMQQKLQELMDMCTNLQQQHLLIEQQIQRGCSKHRGMDQGEDLIVIDTKTNNEKSTEKGSENTDEMANVLSTLGAANVLSSGGTTSTPTGVDTASESFPTTVIFTTASVTTPYTRKTRASRGIIIESSPPIPVNIPSISNEDKGKGIMTEPKQPSKEKVLEQMSAQLARELEAKIHAERELKMMIAELDRSNEMVAKYLSEYQQAEAELSHDEKLATKAERRKFYMSVLRSNAEWKSKDFKGMTFEQIKEKFIPVWKQMQDFVPMNSKLEKPSQEQQTKEPKELSEEELKKRMEIVPIEEFYIEALQVKYPIIDWEIYSEEQRKYWKIIRVGNHTEVYQIFEEMLKKIDREDLDRLWCLVKKTFSTTDPTEDKEKELWVELKRLYEPDPRDQLWALQKYMHDPLEWRLYDTCGVHHVSTRRGHKIFMLVEKDYPLKKDSQL
ncbi:hypothetical protein Tco_0180528 [Tanacetum coccineum]